MPLRHKLYDGLPDDFRIQGGRIHRRPVATLAALQWAAERANFSYGCFTLNLSTTDQRHIQAEYESFQRERKNDLDARPRVDISTDDV